MMSLDVILTAMVILSLSASLVLALTFFVVRKVLHILQRALKPRAKTA